MPSSLVGGSDNALFEQRLWSLYIALRLEVGDKLSRNESIYNEGRYTEIGDHCSVELDVYETLEVGGFSNIKLAGIALVINAKPVVFQFVRSSLFNCVRSAHWVSIVEWFEHLSRCTCHDIEQIKIGLHVEIRYWDFLS